MTSVLFRLPACLLLALTLLVPTTLLAGPEYAVQFTVPSDREKVWKFVEMLSELGYPSYMFTQDRGADMVHYYAQMGTYASFDAAQRAAQELQQKVRVDFAIVQANTNKIVTRAEEKQDGVQASSTPEQPPREAAPVAEASKPEPQAVAEPVTPPASDPVLPAEPEPVLTAEPEPAAQKTAVSVEALAHASPEPAPESYQEASREALQAEATRSEPVTAEQPTSEPSEAPSPEQTQPEQTVAAAAPPAPLLPPSSTGGPRNTVFLVQAHSFSVKDNALKAAREYESKGYDPLIILLYDNKHTPWYVLSLGYYGDRATAREAAHSYQARENRSLTLNQVDANFITTRVVPYN